MKIYQLLRGRLQLIGTLDREWDGVECMIPLSAEALRSRYGEGEAGDAVIELRRIPEGAEVVAGGELLDLLSDFDRLANP